MIKILDVEHVVKNRLQELGMKNNQLSKVAERAISQKRNAVLNHPRNAPGMFAYLEGVRALRDIIVDGSTWNTLTQNNLEYIENNTLKIKILYQNVDCACDKMHDPQPLHKRTATAKQNAINSNQDDIFGVDLSPTNVWLFCVSENKGEINAELSLPAKLENGSFYGFYERIFILKGYHPDDIKKSNDNNHPDYDDIINISLKI